MKTPKQRNVGYEGITEAARKGKSDVKGRRGLLLGRQIEALRKS